MQSDNLRQRFFDYFTKHGHTRVASSSLIPAQDPTLLFTNAGMNQFKDVFLGTETKSYTRAVSIQKCLRAGGKGSDLENVGTTKRHLTFFEMMGSFSFGDYFKEQAIQLAWEFLTKELGLPAQHMYASVYYDDEEAYRIWRDVIGLPEERIARRGAEENFWQMGATGPCGPCSEIHLDQSPDKAQEASFADDEERYLEVWNLVFIEYNKHDDGTMTPLERTGVDTGMGLERLCTIMQNVDSVFATDLFTPLLDQIGALTGITFAQASEQHQTAFRVIADHVRSSALAIADGCMPANDGRGYVLRKIIRRAALYAQELGNTHILPHLAPTFIEQMGPIYEELTTNRDLILSLLQKETNKFAQTLEHGKNVLYEYMENTSGTTITGEQAFTLYDTYGFPLDLTHLIAQQHGYTLDTDGFQQAMDRQKERSKQVQRYEGDMPHVSAVTEFTGYRETNTRSHITALIADHELVETVAEGETCWVITQQSPFYAESGGQISDTGTLYTTSDRAHVTDVRMFNNAIGVCVTAPHDLHIHDDVILRVDAQHRAQVRAHHTATHLLHAALGQVLGSHVKQAGSLVTPEQVRFDVTHHEAISEQQLKTVEDIVNRTIRDNVPIVEQHMGYEEAVRHGAVAFFGERYPEQVRVIEIPGISKELCGGTHVGATGEIGCFKITNSSALSAGVRRITAVAGQAAMQLFQERYDITKQTSHILAVQPPDIPDTVEKQIDTIKQQKQQINELQQQIYQLRIPEWLTHTQHINGIPFAHIRIDNADNKALRSIAQQLMDKQAGVYALTSKHADGKTVFLVACSSAYQDRVSLAELKQKLQEHNYKGGGKGNIVQGAAHNPDHSIEEIIQNWLS